MGVPYICKYGSTGLLKGIAMTNRDFTMTETLDLEDVAVQVEDNYAVTQTGARIEAVGDNAYRVTWPNGRTSVFDSLMQALEEVC